MGVIPIADLIQDPSFVLKRVSEVRNLPQRVRTPVMFQDEAAFRKTLRQQMGTARAEVVDARIATFAAFSSAKLEVPTVSHKGWVGIDEGVIGLYEFESRSIVMRRAAAELKLDDGATVDQSAWTLAHEAMHALQHQHFPHPDYGAIKNEDQLLATQAVFEGDAMLAMRAYVASNSWTPVRRALIEHELKADEEAAEGYQSARGSKLEDSPASSHEPAIFPYRDGFRFMSAIFRTGGAPLTDRVYRALPLSTEQILHPEKYVQGERPRALAVPPVPSGWRSVAVGTLGELRIRAALLECIDEASASEAAAGWGGDTYNIVSQGIWRRLLWSTVWDSSTDAAEFERAVQRLAKCWKERDRALGDRASSVGEFAITLSDHEVSVAYGYPETEAPSAATALIGKVPPLPINVRPLPVSTLASLPKLPEVRAPYFSNGWFVFEEIDIAIPVFRDLEYASDNDVMIAERRGGSRVRLWVGSSDWKVTSRSLHELQQRYAEFVHDHFSTDAGVFRAEPVTRTALGGGYSGFWRFPGWLPMEGRRIVIPICKNRGSITVSMLWEDWEGERLANRWLAGIRRHKNTQLPRCARLLMR